MNPQQYCADLVQRSGSNFARSFFLLTPARREAIIALYAFCRQVDDVTDGSHHIEPAVAQAKLDWWRREIAGLYQGSPQHPISKALQPSVQAFELPQEWLQEIIDGVAMDLTINRYNNFTQLQLYCHRVAAVVGWSVARILGFHNQQTLKYAHTLGIACQLTNIIRDVAEDAGKGRIYVPLDELSRFGISESDILHHASNEEFVQLMRFQVTRAQEFFQRAWALIAPEDVRAQRVGLAMGATYQALLRQVSLQGFQAPLVRVSLAAPYRLWVVASTWLFPKSMLSRQPAPASNS